MLIFLSSVPPHPPPPPPPPISVSRSTSPYSSLFAFVSAVCARESLLSECCLCKSGVSAVSARVPVFIDAANAGSISIQEIEISVDTTLNILKVEHQAMFKKSF